MLDLAMITSTAPKSDGAQARKGTQDEHTDTRSNDSFEKQYEAADTSEKPQKNVRENGEDRGSSSEAEKSKPEADSGAEAKPEGDHPTEKDTFENVTIGAAAGDGDAVSQGLDGDDALWDQSQTDPFSTKDPTAAADETATPLVSAQAPDPTRIAPDSANAAPKQGPRLPSAAETALNVRAADQAQVSGQAKAGEQPDTAANVLRPVTQAQGQVLSAATDPKGSATVPPPLSAGVDVSPGSEMSRSRRADRSDNAEILRPEAKLTTSSAAEQRPPQATPPTAAMQMVMPTSITEDTLDPLTPISDQPDVVLSTEARGATSVSSTALSQILARGETPSMVARQMAEALQRLPDKPVEISLNPRELGRVRMNISAAEAGITVNVIAERPETLDLLRRNIEQLATEFQAIGYESINFAFAEGQSGQTASDEGADGSGSEASRIELVSETEDQTHTQTTAPTTGMDLRL